MTTINIIERIENKTKEGICALLYEYIIYRLQTYLTGISDAFIVFFV